MADIQNLVIRISSNAEAAINTVDRLASALNHLKDSAQSFSLNKVVSAIKQVQKVADKATESINRMADAQARLQSNINGFSAERFTDQMNRYTNAVNEGTNALVRFTNAIRAAQSAYNSYRMQIQQPENYNYNVPQIAGQSEPIYTDFVDNSDEAERAVSNIQREFVSLFSVLRNVGGLLGSIGSYLGSSFGTALARVGSGIGAFIGNLARIAKYRFIRSIIKDLTQSFKDLYGWSNKFGTDFADSADRINTAFLYLRNSIAAMAAPLVNAVAPALDYIIDLIVDVLNWVNQLFSALSGADSYTVAKKVKQSWGDALSSTSKTAKKTADEVKRTILGFDEINKLTKDAQSSSGSSGGSSPYSKGYQYMFEELPLSNGFKELSNAVTTALQDTLTRIEMIISGAELAVGAILLFTGANPALGLGLMAAGAIGLGNAIVANWSGISKKVKSAIGLVESVLAGGLAVGAVLAFSGGHIGLGIGLMAAALSAGYGAVKLSWSALSDKVGGKVRAIAAIIGGAMVGVGGVMIFAAPQLMGLGLSLVAAGVTTAAVSIQWGWISNKLKDPIDRAVALVSSAALAVGAILLFTGANPALGLGLMAAGAIGLGNAIVANWNGISKKVKSAIGLVESVLAGGLAVGAVLAFSGGHIGLGIGLMAAALSAGYGSATLSWDTLSNKVGGKVRAIAAIIGGAMVGIGGVMIFAAPQLMGLGLALVAAGVTTSAISIQWDWLSNKLKGPIGRAVALVSGASLVLGILCLLGGLVPIGIGLIAAGVVGLVTTAAANWDNLVKLGEDAVGKVKEGWDSLRELTVEFFAKVRNDASLWWSNVQHWWDDKVGVVRGFIATVRNDSKTWWSNVQHWWDDKVGVVKSFVTGVKDDAETWWGNVKKWWKTKIRGKTVADIVANISNTSEKWWSDVKGFWEKATENLSLGAAVDFLVNVVVKIAGKVWKYGTKLWDILWGTEEEHEDRTKTIEANLNLKPGVGFDDFSVAKDPTMWYLDKKVQQSFNQNPLNVTVDAKGKWQKAFGGIKRYLGLNNLDTSVNVSLKKNWWGSVKDALNLNNLKTTIAVALKTTTSSIKLATAGGGQWRLETKAKGGIFANGAWGNIPSYANGTTNAHGSLFLAGEAGPEIVGHVGGRTEVLNKSQIAAAMYQAVRSAMSNLTLDANFYGDRYGNGEDDYETMYQAMYDAFTAATAGSADRDREKVALLRQISDKDYNLEISTSGINKAQMRTNRRAGTTIVPVGT